MKEYKTNFHTTKRIGTISLTSHDGDGINMSYVFFAICTKNFNFKFFIFVHSTFFRPA